MLHLEEYVVVMNTNTDVLKGLFSIIYTKQEFRHSTNWYCHFSVKTVKEYCLHVYGLQWQYSKANLKYKMALRAGAQSKQITSASNK